MPSSLFPVLPSRVDCGFTTSRLIRITGIVPVDLADTALGVHKSSGGTHNVVSDDQGKQTWEAHFPAGSINPGNKHAPRGGFGFYLTGPAAFQRVLKEQRPEEVLMSYEVLFQDGWAWRKGGKLPGICTSACPCARRPLTWNVASYRDI